MWWFGLPSKSQRGYSHRAHFSACLMDAHLVSQIPKDSSSSHANFKTKHAQRRVNWTSQNTCGYHMWRLVTTQDKLLVMIIGATALACHSNSWRALANTYARIPTTIVFSMLCDSPIRDSGQGSESLASIGMNKALIIFQFLYFTSPERQVRSSGMS